MTMPIARRSVSAMLLAVALLAVAPQTGWAHVGLDAPNGGETLYVGSTFSIQWHPIISHADSMDFDLWYSTSSATGPWTDIALDLPLGDTTPSSAHLYDWLVPNDVAADVWVRVRQDNMYLDYEDVSNASFAIVAPAGPPGDCNGDGTVDAADYTTWRDSFGQTGTGLAADGNGNGQIDEGDFTVWKQHFGQTTPNGSGSLGSANVPEPASGPLLVLAATALLARHHG